MDKEQEEEYYRLYKILLLGDVAVGKSCLLLRYCENSFQESHLSTIGLDFRLKTISLENNRKIRIQIWDTAGEDRFRAITKNYYKGAHGIILIYDVTDQQSFQHIKDWVDKIKEESNEGVIIYLVGNKIDLIDKREVKKSEAENFARKQGVKYIEKTGTNPDEVSSAADALIAEGVDAVFTPTDNTVMNAELAIYEKLAEAGIPHFCGADSFALNGAFCGFGVNYKILGTATADMTAELLGGADPAKMPVQTFENGIATVNTQTAELLGADMAAVSEAFGPYCSEIVETTTAKDF